MLKPIRHSKLKHDSKGMFVAAVAISAMPITIWLMKDRPLRAATAQELATKVQARQESKDDFWRKFPSHVVIYDHDDPSPKWSDMADANEASTVDAMQILHAARTAIGKECWPIYMEQGWIDDQKVWIVGGARGHQSGGLSCSFSSYSEQHLSHWTRLTATVESKAPFRVLWRTPEPTPVVDTTSYSE
jgi:hypothetical protein